MAVSPGVSDEQVSEALQGVFGLEGFRPGQAEAVDALLGGRDLLAVMPTGAGKSLCFQLPAVVHEGLTLVISPLIALMKDQVDALHRIGVRAAYLASTQTTGERSQVLREVRAGGIDLLYVSPERLGDSYFLEIVSRLDVWLVAVDEAHCISTWGSDFRPDYLRIPDAIDRLRRRPVVAAFTATATPEVREDLAEQLRLREPERVLAGFDRPNIRFLVKFCRKPGDRMTELSVEVKNRQGTGIIYAGTRKAAEEQAAWLRADGRRALAYHAGLSPAERTEAQDSFLSGAIDVIVATNAFGMGIDKRDVRFVIHTSLPASLDAYYQEAGRAGRDGEPSDALLMYVRSDRQLQEWLIDQDLPSMNDLIRLHNAVKASRGELELEEAAAGFDSPVKMRVGLQVLARAGVIELGERNGTRLTVSTDVARVGQEQVIALERAISRQRAEKLGQVEEMIAYAEGSTCRREALLSYYGDPAAEPGGDATCCDICARPDARSAGELARLSQARKLLKPKRLSKNRAAIRDALAEHGNVPDVARSLGMNFKKVGDEARKLVAEGQLDVEDVVPEEVRRAMAEAVERMDDARFDYRRPRQGYLQAAMRFCPDGTSWDHLALYLAWVRRQEALDEIGDVSQEDLQAVAPPSSGSKGSHQAQASSDTVTETLEMFKAGRSVAEISEERGLKPITVEGHLVTAMGAGRLELAALVDDETAAIVRQAIAETPPSDTPLRDIRNRAAQIAGRDVPYVAINAVRNVERGDQPESTSPPGTSERNPEPADEVRHPESSELTELRERKAKAERLRARHEADGKPWPDRWDAEYRRILVRIEELTG